MKKKTAFFLCLVFSFAYAIAVKVEAQVKIRSSVIGSGGSVVSDSSVRIIGTLGQAVIGASSDAAANLSAGFWNTASDIVTSVEQIESSGLPTEFRLEQNYPNPFNPTTTIQFALPRPSQVTLKLFDLRGRLVATLVDEKLAAGQHKVVFDASGLPSGVYFYRMQAKNFQAIKKLSLIK